ncbi:acyltransferase family protein [uncultured Cohaesibacter sp.]|uniref:acyltransferase family protein n=1 Tax=uncultured Cohaesibacter sp. TaxID=1002546 RepID=UPI0029C8511F|nr:acyltransferase family protein [uncultured Cohaesibacter sp.]
MNGVTQSNRWNGMDFARAVLMILGLFFHAGRIYGNGENWIVISDETCACVNAVDYFIHSFRMEAFYLIAGFFFALVYEKHRPKFLRDRLARIAIPLLFCGILINPVMHYFAYGADYITGKDYILHGQWMEHLWFLGNLTIYILISIPACNLIRSKVKLNKTQLFYLILLVVPLVAAGLNFAANHIYSGIFLFVAVESIFNYWPYYILGIICFYNKHIFMEILNIRTIVISLAICAAMLAIIEIMNIFSIALISKIFYALLRGPMVLLVLSTLIVIGSKESRIVRSFSDSSYTIYLLHLPLFVFLYRAIFQHTHLGALQEYALLIAITYAISYCVHIFIIDKSPLLGFAFNGKVFDLGRYTLLGTKRQQSSLT